MKYLEFRYRVYFSSRESNLFEPLKLLKVRSTYELAHVSNFWKNNSKKSVVFGLTYNKLIGSYVITHIRKDIHDLKIYILMYKKVFVPLLFDSQLQWATIHESWKWRDRREMKISFNLGHLVSLFNFGNQPSLKKTEYLLFSRFVFKSRR